MTASHAVHDEPKRADAAKIVCPECGRVPTSKPDPVWLVRRRRLVQVVVVLTALIAYLAQVWATWPPPVAATAFGPGASSYDFPLVRFSPADIGAYARGERADGQLLKALTLDNPFGSVSLEVGFAPPFGNATEFRRIGWPTNWLVYRWDGTYEDVYSRQGAIKQPPVREPAWHGPTHIAQSIDDDGRRESRIITTRAIIAPIVVLIAAHGLGRLIGGFVRRRTRSSRFGPRMMGMLFAVIAIAAIAVLSLGSTVETTNMLTPVPPKTVPIGLTTSDVARMGEKPDGEQELAAAILPHAAGAAPADVLIIGPGFSQKMQQSSTFAGWPNGSIIVSRIEPFDSQPNAPVLQRIRVHRDSIQLVFADAAIPSAQRYVSLSMITLFEVLAGLMLSWYVAGWAIRGVALLSRRRERRRAESGRCTWCNYHANVTPPTA